MTDLTKASEARSRVLRLAGINAPALTIGAALDAYAEAVRSDTLADVAARLPGSFHAATCGCNKGPADYDRQRAAAILAHLTPDR